MFLSDEGLVERQTTILAVARPIAEALDRLDEPPNPDEGEESSGPDPDEIRSYLEDALVLLGNANIRLNAWRQKRFAEYLTDVGKRILKEDIPTDKHLFPDKFHQVVQSEHDHSKTNSKVIAAPYKPSFQKGKTTQPFRAFSSPNNSGQRQWGKRKWQYKKSSLPNQRSEFGHASSSRASFTKRPRLSKDSNEPTHS